MRALSSGDPGVRVSDARARPRLPRALLLVRGVRSALNEGRPLWHAGWRRALSAALRDGRRAASGTESAGSGLSTALSRPAALSLARVPPPSSSSSRAAASAPLDAPPAPAQSRQPGTPAAFDTLGTRCVFARQGTLLQWRRHRCAAAQAEGQAQKEEAEGP